MSPFFPQFHKTKYFYFFFFLLITSLGLYLSQPDIDIPRFNCIFVLLRNTFTFFLHYFRIVVLIKAKFAISSCPYVKKGNICSGKVWEYRAEVIATDICTAIKAWGTRLRNKCVCVCGGGADDDESNGSADIAPRFAFDKTAAE